MNELSKANEWEFWDYDVSAASSALHSNEEPKNKCCSCNDDGASGDCKINHILPSHIEAETSNCEEDDIDKAWREFDSYSWESILHSASYSNQSQADEAQAVSDVKLKSQANKETKSTSISGGRKKTLNSSRDKSQSPPRLNDVKSNCKGARAA